VPPFDAVAVRSRFASLCGDFVFLDAPGGTQTPDEVAAAVTRVHQEASGNGGAPYATSRRIDALVATFGYLDSLGGMARIAAREREHRFNRALASLVAAPAAGSPALHPAGQQR
jgi:hypothetical protein